MSHNLKQCRAYLSVRVCRNLLGYFDLQWELVLFLYDTVSTTVVYMAVLKQEIEFSDVYLCHCQSTNFIP